MVPMWRIRGVEKLRFMWKLFTVSRNLLDLNADALSVLMECGTPDWSNIRFENAVAVFVMAVVMTFVQIHFLQLSAATTMNRLWPFCLLRGPRNANWISSFTVLVRGSLFHSLLGFLKTRF